jgi:hypothetical protein
MDNHAQELPESKIEEVSGKPEKQAVVIFRSEIHQENGIIDASQLYRDIVSFISMQSEKFQAENLGRTHPLQHILNSTSGGYISPSTMKSFDLCPAGYLVGKLFREKTGTATSVGRTFHNIMESFYNGEVRTKVELDRITKETVIKDEQFEREKDVLLHVEGYWDSDDYLGGPMNHRELQVATEIFIKTNIRPLGVDVGVPMYLKMDRIDVRNIGLCVVDYKTGEGDPNPYLLGEHGYLPQMIYYKWGAEAEYGETVKKVILSCPGAYTKSLRNVEMDVHSLVQQSKVLEQTMNHLEHIKKARETKRFECSYMRYCGSCHIKWGCQTWLKSKGMDEKDVQKTIPIEIEVLDKVYTEEDG